MKDRCSWECQEPWILTQWRECNLVQTLWKLVWSPSEINCRTATWSNSTPGQCAAEIITISIQIISLATLLTVLSTAANLWHRLWCPSTNEWDIYALLSSHKEEQNQGLLSGTVSKQLAVKTCEPESDAENTCEMLTVVAGL